MRIVYAEKVFEELVELSLYLAEESYEASQRFLDACEASIQFLAENPQVGATRQFNSSDLSNIRIWRIKSFEKYLIFYHPIENGIRVVHVIHSARDYPRIFGNDQLTG